MIGANVPAPVVAVVVGGGVLIWVVGGVVGVGVPVTGPAGTFAGGGFTPLEVQPETNTRPANRARRATKRVGFFTAVLQTPSISSPVVRSIHIRNRT
jgi:hypothetical protein